MNLRWRRLRRRIEYWALMAVGFAVLAWAAVRVFNEELAMVWWFVVIAGTQR